MQQSAPITPNNLSARGIWQNATAIPNIDINQLDFVFDWLNYHALPRITGLWYHQKSTLLLTIAKNQDTFVVDWQEFHAPFSLSKRELQIINLVHIGLGSQEIARLLSISKRTIDKHIENIFSKTGVNSKVALVALGIKFANLEHISTLPDDVLLQLFKQANQPKPPRKTTNTLKLGMPIPLSGIGSDDAHQMLLGTQLAIEQINQSGGIFGQKLELSVIDTDITNPKSIKSAFDTLAGQDVIGINAGYFYIDDELLTSYADYQAPFLHVATLNKMVDYVKDNPHKYEHLFQICASDITYGKGFIYFLNDLIKYKKFIPHNQKINIIQGFWSDMDIGMGYFERYANELNWQIDVIKLPSIYTNKSDWQAIIQTLWQALPSVIVFASFLVEESIAFWQAFRQNPVPALVYKIYTPSVPIYRQTLGELANGVLWATTTGLYHDKIAQKFATAFYQAHGQELGASQASSAYDRVHMLAQALRQSSNPHDFKAVNHALKNQVYRGVNGAYYLENAGQVGLSYPFDTPDMSIAQAHLVYQIKAGQQAIISPKPYVVCEFELPSWYQI